MDGDTSDLRKEESFARDFTAIMSSRIGIEMTQEQVTNNAVILTLCLWLVLINVEVARLMGIKRTNASTLSSVGYPGAASVYPIYNLMNSFCKYLIMSIFKDQD